MSSPIDEGADHGRLNTLEYVLRGRDLRARLRWLSHTTPWWIISIAFHLAVALVLLRVVGLVRVDDEPEDTIVITEPHEDPPRLDPEKIAPIFQPYWAVFVLRSGKKYTGYVTAEDRERGTITLTVPRNGSATRPRSFFKDIRRILPPPGARPDPLDRI